jgi:hypothetical protein
MPSIVNADQAAALTEPFHELWVSAYRLAEKRLRSLREFDSEAFLSYESPTLARMVRDHVVRTVRHDERVSGSSALGTFTQIINGAESSVLIRFKELDQDLKRFNHKSGRQDGLDLHRYDPDDYALLADDGLNRVPTLLSCGYVRDFDIIGISRIVVVCHWGRNPLWRYDLEDGSVQEVVQFPNIEPPQSTVVSRVNKDARPAEMD